MKFPGKKQLHKTYGDTWTGFRSCTYGIVLITCTGTSAWFLWYCTRHNMTHVQKSPYINTGSTGIILVCTAACTERMVPPYIQPRAHRLKLFLVKILLSHWLYIDKKKTLPKTIEYEFKLYQFIIIRMKTYNLKITQLPWVLCFWCT